MIKEAYCSCEISELLKEKGFDEKVFTYYEDGVLKNGFWFEWNRSPLGHIAAPTIQMACAWLREEHGIFIAINNDDLDFNWQCYDLINRESTLDPKILSNSYAGYKTYEDAIEAALKYSLENLI